MVLPLRGTGPALQEGNLGRSVKPLPTITQLEDQRGDVNQTCRKKGWGGPLA